MGLEEADEYHPAPSEAARSPLRRNPTLLLGGEASAAPEDAAEEAVGPRWMAEIKAGPAATRSLVVHEPGFYVVRLAAVQGGLKNADAAARDKAGSGAAEGAPAAAAAAAAAAADATNGSSAGPKSAAGATANLEDEESSLEQVARSLSTRKRLSKRERFRAKVAALRHSATGTGSTASSSKASSSPSSRGLTVDVRVRDVHHRGVVVMNSSAADPEPTLEEYSGLLRAADSAAESDEAYAASVRLRSSSADEAFAAKKRGPAANGASSAKGKKKTKDDKYLSGGAVTARGLVLYSDASAAATGAASFYLDPNNVPGVLEVSMKTSSPYFVVSELFISHKESALSVAPLRQRRSSSLNEVKVSNAKFARKSTRRLQLRDSESASGVLAARPQSARNSKKKPNFLSMDDIDVRPMDGFADAADAHSEGEPDDVDLADRLRPSFAPRPGEVTIEGALTAEPPEPPASSQSGNVATSNRHRRAMSLFARYSDMTATQDSESEDEDEGEDGDVDTEDGELAGAADATGANRAEPTEHVQFASKRKVPRRRKLNAAPAHVNAMATPEMSPDGLAPTPFERIWNELDEQGRSDISFRDLNEKLRDVPILLKPLVTQGRWFYEFNGVGEPLGRAVLLRGVNLSGNVKLPFSPDARSHVRVDWATLKDPSAAAALSFVGRPFPLGEAHEHFSRLRRWGFNCFRFLVTWEAIEHAGPGEYDVEYLDYVEAMVRIAGTYGFYVFVDPHQDVWSRMTGGSGAPAWTLTAAGLDLANLEASEAAFTHNVSADPAKFQRMSWPQNYQRFAAAHMFTLFWGGNDFAPDFAVEGGIPIQEYLQRHFIDAMLQVARRVKDMPHVVGFDSFNEPSPGFIGSRLDGLPEVIIPPGPVFRPIDAMVTAAGHSSSVGRANSIGLITGRYKANPTRTSVWREGVADVWKEHGLYDVQTVTNENGAKVQVARILNNEYFCNFPRGSASVGKVEFFRDYLRPFMVLYISRIRALMPRAILFAEGDGFGEKEFVWDHADPRGVVNASHWYDGFTLFTANFNPRFSVDVSTKLPVFGAGRIYNMHMRDLRAISELPRALDGAKMEMPTLIGEFGIPFNMNNKYGFRTGDFRMHERAMSVYYDVMDALQLHSTQWNYCGDNCNDWGDNWNLEDLSLFSRDQQSRPATEDIESGGRGTCGFSRPFAPFVCGLPTLTLFQRRSKSFEHSYEPNPRNFEYGNLDFATEIFVPDIQYVARATASVVQFDVVVEGGKFKMLRRPGRHILFVWADQEALEASNHMNCVTVRIFFPMQRDAGAKAAK